MFGCTEQEAATAAAKAAELLAEHRLSAAAVHALHDDITEQVGEQAVRFGSTRTERWKDILAAVVSRCCHCDAIKDTEGRRYLLIGRPTDVGVAIATFEWIVAQVSRLAIEALRRRAIFGRRGTSSFMLGAARTIAERMRAEHDARRQGAVYGALVVADQAAVARYIATRHRTRTVRAGGGRIDRDAYSAGQEAGHRVSLRRDGIAAGGRLALAGA